MIGQKKIQNLIRNQINDNSFPTCALLVGLKGSGKKTLLKGLFPSAVWVEDVTVGSIRKLIDDSYKYYDTKFIVPDIDNISNTAQNALLKVLEDCPGRNSYILTVSNEGIVLDTIKSRCAIYYMDRYTPDEIGTYYHDYAIDRFTGEQEIVLELCETPGEVNALLQYGVQTFFDYITLVVDHVDSVSTANVFKIDDRVAFKDEPEKYDLKLFWKAFIDVCMIKSKSHSTLRSRWLYYEWVKITGKRMKELYVNGINKQMLFDSWLIDIRNAEVEG